MTQVVLIRRMLCAVALMLVSAINAWAVEPSEMLDDPVLEQRAQALDEQIKCVKCRSETIASSNADWAADARKRVREIIAAGGSDQDVLDFFVSTYGEYVLMKPQTGGANLILWLAGPLMLLFGGLGGAIYVRNRGRADAGVDALSQEEQARLDEIMKD